MNSDIPEKLLILFHAFSEATLSESQLSELDDILSADKAACEYFLEYINMCATLKGGKTIDEEFCFDTGEFESASAGSPVRMDSNTSLHGVDLNQLKLDDGYNGAKDGELTRAMLELLELERTSPAFEIEKPAEVKPKRELIQKVESNFKLFPGEGNKSLTRAYLALAACIMMFVGYVYFFVTDPIDRPVVAKLADSIEAVWDNKLEMPDEFGDMVQSRYRLKDGYASVLFSEGAKVTIEAPAEFSLNSSGDVELFSGKIYAVVPGQAHGFTVKAGINKIVDLGTEFGVELDNNGSTQLHVIKGKTLLFADLHKGIKSQFSVDAGSAKKVYSNGLVKDVPVEKNKFVRKIDSSKGIVETLWDFRVSYIPITSDNDSGISTSKTYTHALDFGEGPAATVNGVVFARVSSGGEFTRTANSSHTVGTGSSSMHTAFDSGLSSSDLNNVTGNIRNLLADMLHGDLNADVTLTGLTPGRRYQLRLYHRHFTTYKEDRTQKLGFDTDGVGVDINGAEDFAVFNEDNAMAPDPGFDDSAQTYALTYDYKLSQGVTTLKIYIKSEKGKLFKPYHVYGLTNEVLSSTADVN